MILSELFILPERLFCFKLNYARDDYYSFIDFSSDLLSIKYKEAFLYGVIGKEDLL